MSEIRNRHQLVRLAKRAESAQVRWHNEDKPGLDKVADDAIKAFETAAKATGYGVIWPGLWPVLVESGHHIHFEER